MATREIYAQTFDEDVSSDQYATCAECGGQVRTNSIETACEDCGLIIDEPQIDYGPEWRSYKEKQTHKVEWGHHGRWLVTIGGCRLRLADGEMEAVTSSLDRSAVDSPGCDVSTVVADSARKQSGTLHTGSARFVESRVPLGFLSRSEIKPVSSSAVRKTRISFAVGQSKRYLQGCIRNVSVQRARTNNRRDRSLSPSESAASDECVQSAEPGTRTTNPTYSAWWVRPTACIRTRCLRSGSTSSPAVGRTLGDSRQDCRCPSFWVRSSVSLLCF